jgi:7-cyano-7-deazaguanine reductase
MSVELSMLGKDTTYPDQYSPEILFPIERAQSRQAYADIPGIQQGYDWWHVFELSWLDAGQKPQVAIGRLKLPANSPYLIESKSLKLYFNSLNFHSFESTQALINCVQQDLSKAAQAPVLLELLPPNGLLVSQPQGILLDDFTPSSISHQPDASLLKLDEAAEHVDVMLYSDLLRSNCPVTGQPDWGTIFVRFQGLKPCYSSLLAYIISFRRHSGFHEQCVEQIFADIWQHLKPERLMVYAAYTRRGGLEINPCRVSDLSWIPDQPVRLARQ